MHIGRLVQFGAVVTSAGALLAGGCGDAPTGGAAPASSVTTTVTPAALEAALEAIEQYLLSGDRPKAEAIAALLVERAPCNVRAREAYARVLGGDLQTHLVRLGHSSTRRRARAAPSPSARDGVRGRAR